MTGTHPPGVAVWMTGTYPSGVAVWMTGTHTSGVALWMTGAGLRDQDGRRGKISEGRALLPLFTPGSLFSPSGEQYPLSAPSACDPI